MIDDHDKVIITETIMLQLQKDISDIKKFIELSEKKFASKWTETMIATVFAGVTIYLVKDAIINSYK